MKTYGGVYLTLALVGDEWCHNPAALPNPPGERAPGTHWIGGWVGPRAIQDDVEKRKFLTLLGLKLRLQPVASHYTDFAIPAPNAFSSSHYIQASNVVVINE
jgi:hypothetical protein